MCFVLFCFEDCLSNQLYEVFNLNSISYVNNINNGSKCKSNNGKENI
jgi:hypothetical protein